MPAKGGFEAWRVLHLENNPPDPGRPAQLHAWVYDIRGRAKTPTELASKIVELDARVEKVEYETADIFSTKELKSILLNLLDPTR